MKETGWVTFLYLPLNHLNLVENSNPIFLLKSPQIYNLLKKDKFVKFYTHLSL